MPKKPIVDNEAISNAVENIKSYLFNPSTLIQNGEDVSSTALNYCGQLRVNIELPIKFSNNEDLLAFSRLLYVQSSDIQIIDARINGDKTFIQLMTNKEIGVNMNETNAQQAERLKGYSEEYKQKFISAIREIAKADKGLLQDGVIGVLNEEQERANSIYKNTREQLASAFEKTNHVVVLGNQVNDPEYLMYFKAALDGSKDITDLDFVRFGVNQGFVDKAENYKSFIPYAEAISQAKAIEGVKVLGDINYYSKSENRDKLTNAEKNLSEIEQNKVRYPELEKINYEKLNNKTLVLTTPEYPVYAKDAVVLNSTNNFLHNSERLEYYSKRYNDGSNDGKFSEYALKETLQTLDKHPNIDISKKGDLAPLWYPVNLIESLYTNAKMEYTLSKAKELINEVSESEPSIPYKKAVGPVEAMQR